MRYLTALAALLLLGMGAWAQVGPGTSSSVEEQWYAKLRETGLPREIVAVMPVEIRSPSSPFPQRLLFVFVYVDRRAVESRTRWRDILVDYVDKHAVLVWAYSQMPFVPAVRFDPEKLWFSQGKWRFAPAPEDYIPVDGDFLSGEVRTGKPVAAIVLLGEGFDPASPLTVHYGDIAEAVIPLVSPSAAP